MKCRYHSALPGPSTGATWSHAGDHFQRQRHPCRRPQGLFEWLAEQNANVVCIQETKAQEHQLPSEVYHPSAYHCYYHDAERKGYSGVALYARREPDEVRTGLGWPECDTEGRWLEARLGA